MISLASQSVYPRLVVKKVKARTDPFQRATRATDYGVPYYDLKEKLTAVDPAEYSLDSLPNTVYSLPHGSIFSYITFLPDDLPDFRMVPVQGSVASSEKIAGRTAPPLVYDSNRRAVTSFRPGGGGGGTSVQGGTDGASNATTTKSTSIFNVSRQHVTTAEFDRTDERWLEDLLGSAGFRVEPLSLDVIAVRRFLGAAYDHYILALSDATINYSGATHTVDAVVASIVKYLNVSAETVRAVLNGDNKHVNRTTAKVGIVNALVLSWTPTQLSCISDELARKLAAMIVNTVDNAAATATTTSTSPQAPLSSSSSLQSRAVY